MSRLTRTHLFYALTLMFAATACLDGETDPGAVDDVTQGVGPAEPDGEAVAVKMRVVGGQGFTFAKYLDRDGQIVGAVFDAGGELVPESSVPTAQPRLVGRSLEALLDGRAYDPGQRIDVVLALREVPVTTYEPEEVGHATFDANGNAAVEVNGQLRTEVDIRLANESRLVHRDAIVNARAADRRDTLTRLTGRYPELARYPAVIDALTEGRASVVVPMAMGEIRGFAASNQDLIAGVELALTPQDELSAAMKDTNIDPYALNYSGRTGSGVGIYMSEGGCPDPGHISNYTRYSGSAASHNKNVSAIIRGVSPDSHVYCRSGYTLPYSSDLDGYGGNPEVFIETHSWGSTTSDNADYRTNDRDFDNHVYDTAVAVFKSAGNFGDDNGYISSPGKALNVISVGNYNDSTDTISVSSSYLDSEIGNEKPELVAPGTSITAGGVTMSGTSMASPHAAGFAADLMGAYTWLQLKPYYLKANMLAGSDKSVSGGSEKVGIGGLNFSRNYYSGTNSWWQGGNSSFDSFDSGDYLGSNGYIDRAVTLNASESNVRIAISWLTRGSYTYDHRNDAHPIGLDLDLCVFDPNGNSVGCSTSFDNPYELVSFDPTITGEYRVRISRYANRDVDSKFHLGLAIDW